MTSLLTLLCHQLGIALDYQDAWGRVTTVDVVTLRRVCKAMGYPAADDDEAAQSLGALRERAEHETLPPALVVTASAAPLACPLRLPAEQIGRPVTWFISLEGGQSLQGTSVASAADLTPPFPAELLRGDGPRLVPAVIELPPGLPAGYHRLALEAGEPRQAIGATSLVVCPPRAHELAGPLDPHPRVWGLSVQLYAVRNRANWGMGDFGDLRELVQMAARAGADFVGINPLHALFPHDPEQASPYSPSSRQWTHVLYLDVEDIHEYAECDDCQRLVGSPAWRARLQALRDAPMVDYAGVAELKFQVFELLYARFRSQHLERGTARARRFRQFQRTHGRNLRLQALYDALQRYFHRKDAALWGWPVWPQAYRDVRGQAVRDFASSHEADVEFFEYLQWQAELQLEAVQTLARELGMRIGLYRDLAIGVNPGGAETWAQPALYAQGVQVGAPPDELNPNGQDWGFSPPTPQRLREAGFKPVLDVLRANMRHAGALRIDHVMGLMRLFWVVPGGETLQGTYVANPFDELLRLVCLESQRHHCIVIGEDLGIVPPEVTAAMERHGLLSYRPFYFEQHWHEGRFKPPAEWPRRALATVGTHDLPTLRAYWTGHDLHLRDELGVYRDPELRKGHIARRARERVALLQALGEQNLLTEGLSESVDSVSDPDPRLAVTVHRYVARTPATMVAVQLEDVLGALEQVNVPGTSEAQYPNWRRKLTLYLAALARDPRWTSLTQALREERPPHHPVAAKDEGAWNPDLAAIPRATYRLQLHAGLRFKDAQALLPYLKRLGISHVYTSPFLKARAGSTHGYDVVDPREINPEIGTQAEFEDFCAALKQHELQLLVDIVPNHMGVLQADNPLWREVLEDGPASRYADHFDIDWAQAGDEEHGGRVLLPVLEGQYGLVLEQGKLQLGWWPEGHTVVLNYYDHRFIIDPRDLPLLMDGGPHASLDAEAAREWQALRQGFESLPPRQDKDLARQAERLRLKDELKQRLGILLRDHPAARTILQARLAAYNGHVGDPRSFDALDDLLQRQAWRLASYRVADGVNYRRFFNINDLAGIRTERDEVFEMSHALLWDWFEQGLVNGVRVDHPDGLADPRAYLERLQASFKRINARRHGDGQAALYLIVEKILGETEQMPPEWPVHGGSGYRFCNLSTRLLVDPSQETRLSRVYRAFTGENHEFDEVLLQSKRHVMEHELAAELRTVTHLLHDITRRDRRTRDHTPHTLRLGLIELTLGFPVYRTYISERGLSVQDRGWIDTAVHEAMRRRGLEDVGVLHLIRDTLLTAPTEPDAQLRELKLAFATRLQQFTAPVMAKSLEDTACYRYNRLLALNEVGGDPSVFGMTVDDFHESLKRLAFTHPHGMLATSTHDSKRSEDVRARLAVLSEMPAAWRLALARWRRLAEPFKRRVDGEMVPTANDEYMIYQSLLGIWPMTPPDEAARQDLAQRLGDYALKAVREAKDQTSWRHPDGLYEESVLDFARRLVLDDGAAAFRQDFARLQSLVARFGAWNSLSLLLLKMGGPGVPDTYQGCEGWNFSLVDPDNRRPVDHLGLSAQLDAVTRAWPEGATPDGLREMQASLHDGRLKLYLTWRGLTLRQRWEGVFTHGEYLPLAVDGAARRHVVAFARRHGGQTVIVVVSRLLFTLCHGDESMLADGRVWGDTTLVLPPGAPEAWQDVLGGRVAGASPSPDGPLRLGIADVFHSLPMAVLVPHEASPA